MPAAVIPAISIGTSIFGGIMGSKAAKSAAQTQSNAANQVAGMNMDAAKGSAAGLDAAAADARANIIDTSGAAANTVQDAGNLARDQIFDASGQAQAGMAAGVASANDTLGGLYRDVTGMTDPYRAAGSGAVNTLAAGLAPGGDLSKKFEFTQDDPSYQWRLDQGKKALERSAAAKGAVSGGGVMKAMERYAQGAASTEYQAAFDRFNKERAGRFEMLSGLAGIGQNAVGQQINAANAYGSGVSNNTLRGAEYIGNTGTRAAETAGDIGLRASTTAGNYRTNAADTAGKLLFDSALQGGNWRQNAVRSASDALLGGANAQAAGTVGSANAWTGAVSGVGNAVAGGLAGSKRFNPTGRYGAPRVQYATSLPRPAVEYYD